MRSSKLHKKKNHVLCITPLRNLHLVFHLQKKNLFWIIGDLCLRLISLIEVLIPESQKKEKESTSNVSIFLLNCHNLLERSRHWWRIFLFSSTFIAVFYFSHFGEHVCYVPVHLIRSSFNFIPINFYLCL